MPRARARDPDEDSLLCVSLGICAYRFHASLHCPSGEVRQVTNSKHGRTVEMRTASCGPSLEEVGKTAGPYYPYYHPSLVVDASGRAYVGSGDGRVRVVTAGGHVVASLRAGPAHHGIPTVLLGPDGKLIVSGTDGVLRAYGP